MRTLECACGERLGEALARGVVLEDVVVQVDPPPGARYGREPAQLMEEIERRAA